MERYESAPFEGVRQASGAMSVLHNDDVNVEIASEEQMDWILKYQTSWRSIAAEARHDPSFLEGLRKLLCSKPYIDMLPEGS